MALKSSASLGTFTIPNVADKPMLTSTEVLILGFFVNANQKQLDGGPVICKNSWNVIKRHRVAYLCSQGIDVNSSDYRDHTRRKWREMNL